MKVAEPYARYLRLLGITRRPAGLDGLRDLVRRHLCRVPFENVSKLLLYAREGAGRPRTLSEFLDGIERHDLGGTCYSSNPFLAELLRVLGYDADLLGADMSLPNVHTSVRVRLDSREYHVDAGYGAPFLEPIPLDRLPHGMAIGRYRYVFDRHNSGGHRMVAAFAGQEAHSYVVHGPPRDPEFFRPIVLDSFAPGRKFMTWLRITRCFEDRVFDLRNRTFTESRGDESRETILTTPAELRDAVAGPMAMPRCPVLDAVAILERLNAKPFFDS
jgi:arylamine N-acetyltransferase